MAYIDKNGVRQEGKPRRLTEHESEERSKELLSHAKGKALKMSKEEYRSEMSKDYGSNWKKNRNMPHASL